MSAARQLLTTAEDLERISADGGNFELIRGELVEMPAVGARQGSRNNRLSSFGTVYVLQHSLGEGFGADTGIILARNPDTVLAPDWAFVVAARVPEELPLGFLTVVPDLVLETRSHNDSLRKIRGKVEMWLAAGVRVVWDLDPVREQLWVHRPGQPAVELGPEDTLTEPELLPGFAVPLASIF